MRMVMVIMMLLMRVIGDGDNNDDGHPLEVRAT